MNDLLSLFLGYYGRIEQTNDKLTFKATNTLYRSYNDTEGEKVRWIEKKPSKVECVIEIIKKDDLYICDAWESSYCIIGGGGCSGNKYQALAFIKDWLEILKFKRKECEQLTLL